MKDKQNRTTFLLSLLIIVSAIFFTVIIIKNDIKAVNNIPTTSTTTANSSGIEEIKLSGLDTDFHEKQPLGYIDSDDFDIHCKLIYGTTNESLRLGAGMHKCSTLPGLPTPLNDNSTCPIIAGHVMSDFQGLKIMDPNVFKDEMPTGKTITITMSYGKFTYEIIDAKIMKADSFKFNEHRASTGSFEPDTIIFYTCYPFYRVSYTKTNRLFLTGKIVDQTSIIIDDRNADK